MPWLKYYILIFKKGAIEHYLRTDAEILTMDTSKLAEIAKDDKETYPLKKVLISAGRFKLSIPSTNCLCHQIPAFLFASSSRS